MNSQLTAAANERVEAFASASFAVHR